jgi:hypothetical protein
MATFPNIAANDLAEHGIITLTSPLFPGVPVPGVNDATFQTAAPAAPVVTASPIGPKVYPGTPDAAGDHYYATPTDALPAGTKWTQSGTTFVKVEIPSPFGFYVYWQRQ